jgi:hypothetical protein
MTFEKWWNAHKPVDVSDDLPSLLTAKSWAREAWEDRQDEIDMLKQEIELMLQACSSCLLRDMKVYPKLPKKGGSLKATKALKKIRKK